MYGFCPLASGSKGNCIFFGSQNTKILIDAGLSGLATIRKLHEINIDLSEIDAILISHEHGDHVRGLNTLARKYGIPVLANHETAKSIAENLPDCPKFKIFSTGETFEFGDLEIHPFSVQHDTLDPVMFTINMDKLKMGFCTDLGFVTSLVRTKLRDCHYLYVEANHEPSMVHACARPMVYKQRVLGRTGHLSNEACGNLLREIAHADLRKVYLAHLSGECNSPDKALQTVSRILEIEGISVDIKVAPQDMVGEAAYFNE